MSNALEANADHCDLLLVQSEKNEWPVYPSTCYTVSYNENNSHESETQDKEYGPILPPGRTGTLDQFAQSRISSFVNEGMQHTVGALIVAHERCCPRVLLFDVGTKENVFEDTVSSTSTIEPDVSLIQTLTLPFFKYERWEQSTRVLEDKLNELLQPKLPTERSIQSSTFTVGSTSEKIPYETGTDTNTRTTPAMDDERNVYPKDEVHPQASSEPSNKQSRAQSNCFTIGSLLGVWCVPEFGTPPLPFIPMHVTRPKEQILLYQVILSPNTRFISSKSSPFKIRFVSFNFLLQTMFLPPYKSLGVAYSGIPSLLCRFSLAFMTLQPIGEMELNNDKSRNPQLGSPSHVEHIPPVDSDEEKNQHTVQDDQVPNHTNNQPTMQCDYTDSNSV